MTDSGLSPSFAHPRAARRSSFATRISPVKQLETVLQTIDNQVYLETLIQKYFSSSIIRELLTAEYTTPTPTSQSVVVEFAPSAKRDVSSLEKSPAPAVRRSVSPAVGESPSKRTRVSLADQLGGRDKRILISTSTSSDELPLRRPGRPLGSLNRTTIRPALSTRSPGSAARAAPKRSGK